MRHYLASAVLLSLAFAAACGDMDLNPARRRRPSQEQNETPTPAVPDVLVGPSHLTRLTRAEYVVSARQILPKDTAIDAEQLPRDNSLYGIFWSNEASPITVRDVEQYALVANSVATSAVASLATLVTCNAGETDDACARRFAKDFVGRAYRRELKAEEEQEYGALIGAALREGDLKAAVQGVIENALQSPYFLYRVEPAPFPVTELDHDALATRLSLFLWRAGPDDELRAAAERGDLATVEGLKAEARRLLADPKASLTIRNFHREWLGIEDLRTVDREPKAFRPAIASAMLTETEMFAEDVFRGASPTLTSLLAADYTFVNPALATFYGNGLTAPNPNGFGKTRRFDRRGLLTHGSVMTAHAADAYTQPIFRGIFVRERVLCQEIGAPSNLNAEVAEEQQGLVQGQSISERQRLDLITARPDCASCHASVNPVGYALQNFDSVGRFRQKDDAGFPIDSKADVKAYGSSTDVDGSYADGRAFIDRLATSESVARCVTKQWLRYALSRGVDNDRSSLEQAYATFKNSGFDLRELLVGIVASDAFRHRATPAP